MINYHTGTAKETPYRSTLRDSQGKAESTIEELETKTYLPEYRLTPNLSRKTQREKS
ncbi:hypothetical protein U3516DRAFT_754656 [Neocallimastix sp. 'constans']